jgi:hypothetical protein
MKQCLWVAALLPALFCARTVRADNAEIGVEDPVCCESPTSNWYVGVDVPVLKPYLGTLGVSFLGTDVDVTPRQDFEVSPRIWLGWENADGLGLRTRYWTFDAEATQEFPSPVSILGADVVGLGSQIKAQTFDFEATQRGCLGWLQFQLAGGFRYAKMETGLSAFGLYDGEVPFNAGVGMDFEGVGPTVALDVRRPFGTCGFALVGGARASWMYGQTDFQLTGDLDSIPFSVYADDHMMQINEVSLGIEWSRCFARGGRVTVAAMWEAQAWEWAPVAGLIHQDVGFSGPTFSFSYLR